MSFGLIYETKGKKKEIPTFQFFGQVPIFMILVKNSNMDSCYVCPLESNLICHKCHIKACSDKHFKMHLEDKSGDCFPFQIGVDNHVGR